MAHPLTQYPPPSLPFPTAPRPSPLAFGFGLPTSPSPLSFNTPPRPTFPSAPSSSFGFGQHASPTSTPLAGPSVHSPRKPLIRPGISPSTSFRTSTTSLKRTRKSPSPTPSSSPSPTSSNLVSPCIGNLDLPRKEKDDPLSVVNLDLGNDGGKKRKEIKRLRKDVEDKGKQNSPSDIDVGVLLAALPSSAHLPILLNILSANPQLAAGVMTNLPKPDHNECLAQLVKHVDAVKRAAGNSAIQLNASRLWGRVEKDVQAFTKTASTYLTFFTSPSDGAPIDPQSIQHLLQGISTHVIYLLRLVPPGSDPNLATIQLLLQLGKRVISAWMKWLDFVSEEVNQRNEMYPHSIVEGWSYNLECLSDADKNINSFTWNQVENTQNDLVNSFKDAMRPIRARFMNELGWLIGRRNTGGANLFAPSGGGMSWNDLHSNNSVNQKEDEEL